MEPLQILRSKREWFLFLSLFFFLFITNLSFTYAQYKDIKTQAVFHDTFQIKNIYPKSDRVILKLTNDHITFFTSVPNNDTFNKLNFVRLYFLTKNISFFEYLKGFYAPSFGLEHINKTPYQKTMIDKINNQHSHQDIKQIYQALFLAIPLSTHIQQQNALFGISHLFAISGFHLSILLAFLYFMFTIIYTPIHKNFYPYRNKRYDILLLSGLIVFLYLIYIDMVASFLRSFVMFIIALYLLRNNIKLLSFTTLFITLLIIIALFPKLLFSLSLWFSIFGVFYIFLFFHYFSHLKKITQFILFNFFIFTSMNPLVHYFFDINSLIQLGSPLLTLLFSLFYPISFILHIFNIGYIFDPLLIGFLKFQTSIDYVTTPLWVFILYIGASLWAIWNRKIFYILFGYIVVFNLYLYLL